MPTVEKIAPTSSVSAAPHTPLPVPPPPVGAQRVVSDDGLHPHYHHLPPPIEVVAPALLVQSHAVAAYIRSVATDGTATATAASTGTTSEPGGDSKGPESSLRDAVAPRTLSAVAAAHGLLTLRIPAPTITLTEAEAPATVGGELLVPANTSSISSGEAEVDNTAFQHPLAHPKPQVIASATLSVAATSQGGDNNEDVKPNHQAIDLTAEAVPAAAVAVSGCKAPIQQQQQQQQQQQRRQEKKQVQVQVQPYPREINDNVDHKRYYRVRSPPPDPSIVETAKHLLMKKKYFSE